MNYGYSPYAGYSVYGYSDERSFQLPPIFPGGGSFPGGQTPPGIPGGQAHILRLFQAAGAEHLSVLIFRELVRYRARFPVQVAYLHSSPKGICPHC